MVATTLKSGQLVHVFGTPPGEFGIYLESPRFPGQNRRLQRVYCYYHRATPRIPQSGWRLVRFRGSELWLLTPLDRVVTPQLLGGYTLWSVPSQPGIPDLKIGWTPVGGGSWVCPLDTAVTPGSLIRRALSPWKAA